MRVLLWPHNEHRARLKHRVCTYTDLQVETDAPADYIQEIIGSQPASHDRGVTDAAHAENSNAANTCPLLHGGGTLRSIRCLAQARQRLAQHSPRRRRSVNHNRRRRARKSKECGVRIPRSSAHKIDYRGHAYRLGKVSRFATQFY